MRTAPLETVIILGCGPQKLGVRRAVSCIESSIRMNEYNVK
jgi:hypothetical protein